MSESINNSFIAYEHKEITVKRDMEDIYTDGYPSFGWEPDGRDFSLTGLSFVTLKFKRDRRITNRDELTSLQQEFENCVREIERMEQAQVMAPSVGAYTIALVGMACMEGAAFAYLAGMTPLWIILAISGFIGWAILYFCYLRVKRSKPDKVTPLIDRQCDTIYEVCEKANGLLYI